MGMSHAIEQFHSVVTTREEQAVKSSCTTWPPRSAIGTRQIRESKPPPLYCAPVCVVLVRPVLVATRLVCRWDFVAALSPDHLLVIGRANVAFATAIPMEGGKGRKGGNGRWIPVWQLAQRSKTPSSLRLRGFPFATYQVFNLLFVCIVVESSPSSVSSARAASCINPAPELTARACSVTASPDAYGM